jgi:hypothetical protein
MNTLRLFPLLLLPLLFGAAASAGENDEPRRDAALALAVRQVKVVRDAERIVVATVKEVHDSPGIWCGFVVTRQEVTYRIAEVVAGGPAEGDVRVGHLLVSGSALVSKDAPFLRPAIFHPGARFLLCLHRDGEKWVVLDEEFGAVAIDPPKTPDPVRTELLRQVLLLPDLLPYLNPGDEDRLPVKVVFTEAMPVAPDLEVFGRRVEFVPQYLASGGPHLKITAITVDDRTAEIRFACDAEGVVGEARFAREDGRLRLTGSKVAER